MKTIRGAERSKKGDVLLRDVVEDDLPIFFEQQLDPDANYMGAFTSREPTDRKAFDEHWNSIISNEAIVIKTIIFQRDMVAGYPSVQMPQIPYSTMLRYRIPSPSTA